MVIGLNGKLQSGKDTTYQIIKEFYPHAERISFADKLKDSAAAALNMDRELMEKLKTMEDVNLVLLFPPDDKYLSIFNELRSWKLSMREYLQFYGTEAHREIFNDNFWVDQALPADIDHSDRLIVVTDVRFPNEVIRVLDLGGVVWKLQRVTESRHSAHPSEQDLDVWVNVFVDNTGSIDDLRVKVKQLLDRMMVPC